MTENPKPDFGDLLAALPDASGGEQFETLLERPGLRIVRIVSGGQATPPDEWFDQEEDEWVVLLRGAAGLLIDGEGDARSLAPGDFAFLPAHCRNRVEWTDPDTPTVWLAIHMAPAAD
ncbi:MAG: cupin domain-containing protein [Proteobacteria bacterium]|nr:cupin domain-containing protein [Pseudomonadota bacterium]